MSENNSLEWISECCNFLASGDLISLKKSEAYALDRVDCLQTLHFSLRAALLCDRVDAPTLHDRLDVLLENKKTTRNIALLLGCGSFKSGSDGEMRVYLLETPARQAFWMYMMIKSEIIRDSALRFPKGGSMVAPLFRELSLQKYRGDADHNSRIQAMVQKGVPSSLIEDFWISTRYRLTSWLPKRDYDFYDAVKSSPSAQEDFLANEMMFNDFSSRYWINMRAKSAKVKALVADIDLYTEGVMRGFLALDATLGYGWFLSSPNAVASTHVGAALEESFRKMASLGPKEFPLALNVLRQYPKFGSLLPEFENSPHFAGALKMLKRDAASKIIAESKMRNHWLNQYPELSEDVFTQELGL